MADLSHAPDNQGGRASPDRTSDADCQPQEDAVFTVGCRRPGVHAVELPASSPGFLLDCPHGAESRLTVKKTMRITNNTIIWTMRNAGRDVAPAPPLSVNACMTPVGGVSGHLLISGLSGGSLSQIVTTQVTHPGNQGTPGDCFPSSLGPLTHPGK